MTKPSDIQDFLDELSELTRKHGFYIGGCGCCGSPYFGAGDSNIPTDHTHHYTHQDQEHLDWAPKENTNAN